MRKSESTRSIFYEDWLNPSYEKADILVTHEAPSCHPHGFDVIDELARSLRALFHGHQHDRLDCQPQYEKLGFGAHVIEFRGVTDMYGKLIKSGNFD